MKKWIKDFLQNKENQELINKGDWEKLYEKVSFLMNTSMLDDELESVWELTSIIHDSGIAFLNDPNLTSIPNHMFYGCKDRQFEIIEIPDHITQIGAEAFSMSESIKKIILPKHLEEIYIYAFAYSDIEEIHYPGTEEEFYNNLSINDTIFEGCEKLKLYFNDGKVKIV